MIDAVGNVQRVLLVGGTSEIGLAVVRRLAAGRRIAVVLAGRPSPALEAAGAALRAEGHTPRTVVLDALDRATWAPAAQAAFADGDVDVAVLAVGVLGDAERDWQDPAAAADLVTVNTTAPVSVGVDVAARLRAQGSGALIVLSSVAGERPRRSNFAYGATKAGLDAFFTGLHEALRGEGVRVLVVRPGFVRTRMTRGLEPAPLAVDADQVAEVAVAGLHAGRPVVWAPPQVRWVMSVLRHVPLVVFRRLPL